MKAHKPLICPNEIESDERMAEEWLIRISRPGMQRNGSLLLGVNTAVVEKALGYGER